MVVVCMFWAVMNEVRRCAVFSVVTLVTIGLVIMVAGNEFCVTRFAEVVAAVVTMVEVAVVTMIGVAVVTVV